MQRVSSEWAKRYSEGCDSAGVRDLALDLLDARAELEQERVRLAGCGVVAMADTPETAARLRAKPGDYGHSASMDDVARRVDECIRLRAEIAAMRPYARFGSKCFEHFWSDGEPGDIEGGDAQEMAVKAGLIGRTSEVDAGATHAEWCEWTPEAPKSECDCYAPLCAPLKEASDAASE